MKVEIYHNSRCSKSRATLALLEEQGVNVEIIEYLKTPPIKSKIKTILKSLDCHPRDIMRRKQAEYNELELDNRSLSEEQLITAIIEHPILLERPIVCHGEHAAIGRPPENVLKLFNT